MHHVTIWQTGPVNPMLPHQELHIWRVAINETDASVVAHARGVLSLDEITRADRFVVEAPRRRFTLARAAMRSILARYTRTDPNQLVFATGHHGKPYLENSGIRFNLSHSENIALLAVARDAEVGVDIEHMNPKRTTDDIAARFFSPAEQTELDRYAGTERSSAFFRGWSRKEAVIKALGEGLACPLDSFDVSLVETEARLIALRRDNTDVSVWNMFAIHASPDYAAAAAIIGPCAHMVGYNLL